MEISGVTYINQDRWSFKVAFDTDNTKHWYVDMNRYVLHMEFTKYKPDKLGFLSTEDALSLFEDLGMTLTAADLRSNIKEAEKEIRGDALCE